MDYKQKYENALSQAKQAINNVPDKSFAKWLQSIFPELRDSEDEKTRKEIIDFLQETIDNVGESPNIWTMNNAKKWIAWLEKQGEKKPIIEGTFVNIDEVREDFMQEVYRVLNADPTNDRANQIIDAFDHLPTIIIQKHADKIEPKFKVGDWIVHDMSDGRKVIRQIVNMTNKSYVLDGEDFNTFYFNDLENDYHLWTIQDAKDGDVLAGSYGTFIFMGESDGYCGVLSDNTFIRSTRNNEWTEGLHPATKEQRDTLMKAMADAGYIFDFEKKEVRKIKQKPVENKGMNLVEEEMTPFQKKVFCIIDTAVEEEQGLKQVCDELLTLASNEIEQKPAERSEEDEDTIKFLISHFCVSHYNRSFQFTSNKLITHDELLKKIRNLRPQPKSEWSEEDELHIRELESLVKKAWTIAELKNDKETIHKMSDLSFFLKTLKPQLKREWSKEDEEMIEGLNNCLDELEVDNGWYYVYVNNKNIKLNKVRNWLKSLRPQKHITDEKLAQAKKDAYNDALDKIEYHSGEPTFDDGWSAAIKCLYMED